MKGTARAYYGSHCDGAFFNQGQVCISLQRIYVMESMVEEFLIRLKEK